MCCIYHISEDLKDTEKASTKCWTGAYNTKREAILLPFILLVFRLFLLPPFPCWTLTKNLFLVSFLFLVNELVIEWDLLQSCLGVHAGCIMRSWETRAGPILWRAVWLRVIAEMLPVRLECYGGLKVCSAWYFFLTEKNEKYLGWILILPKLSKKSGW